MITNIIKDMIKIHDKNMIKWSVGRKMEENEN